LNGLRFSSKTCERHVVWAMCGAVGPHPSGATIKQLLNNY
jgi:hypothetical protein